MKKFTYADLDKMVEDGYASTCISVNDARIIIPTACDQVVGFTNPDDLDVNLLARWKKGERGPEFENQKLKPGDCLIMYNNGRDINKLLDQYPDWYKSAEGIKNMIDRLYDYVENGAKETVPAIWNTDLHWANKVNLTTTAGEKVTEDMWREKSGVALEVVKSPDVQYFIHMKPGDELISPGGNEQVSGAMSAIAVKQPSGGWNIVQLNAKGYAVVEENIRAQELGDDKKKGKGLIDLLSRATILDNDKEAVALRKEREGKIAEALKETENLQGEEKRKAQLEILRKTDVQDLRDKESIARNKKLGKILKSKYKQM